MSEVKPANIRYKDSNGEEQVLRFHAVVAETHTASSEVTKYPVQTGEQVSTHKIKKNRLVSIKGVITNVQLLTSNNFIPYSSTNNAKTVFEILKGLINNGTPCTVETNLDTYFPVIFTKFNSKQAAGLVDSMHFTISGEEIQLSGNINITIPRILSFKTLTDEAEIAARKKDLFLSGIDVCKNAVLAEATMTIGENFIINGLDNLGLPVTTTYINKGIDTVKGSVAYSTSISGLELFTDKASEVLSGGVLGDVDVAGGLSSVGGCIVEGAADVIEDAATDLVDTALGKLEKTLFGALYDTMNLVDNEYGQSLIHAGIGCMVRGVTGGNDSIFPFLPGESLPSTTEIIEGAKRIGEAIANADDNVTIAEAYQNLFAKEVITYVRC